MPAAHVCRVLAWSSSQPDLQSHARAMADDRGEFRIEGLLPGPYHVSVTAKGFAEATADVNVAVSVVRDIAVTLNLAAGRETVNVQATPSSITTRNN